MIDLMDRLHKKLSVEEIILKKTINTVQTLINPNLGGSTEIYPPTVGFPLITQKW